jgi:ribosomal protein S18 acetylase RimI-like enzyme
MDTYADDNQPLSAHLPFETIRAIEAAAYDAWPALERTSVDGWRLRAAEGVTGRANSVWAIENGGVIGLDEKIAAVERFYGKQGLPSRFQINAAVQPDTLDGILAARGYQIYSPTRVEVAPLERIMEHTPNLRSTPHLEIEVAEEFDDQWFATYARNEAMDAKTTAVRAAILGAIKGPRAFARLDIEGAPVAVGLGVVGGDWLGIFCMATHPLQRRRGAALGLLRALAIWGSLYDATGAYLQVDEANLEARALYARAGFTQGYGYHYRVGTND